MSGVARLFARSNQPNERKPNMKALAAFIAAAVLSMVAGCNTVEGVGQDVQAGGRAVERAADKSNPTRDPKKY
jgi:entericidin B